MNAAIFGGFNESTPASGTTPVALTPTRASTAPYEPSTLPRDILNHLPPNGEPFSLFGDPYAQLHYMETATNVIRASQYWLRGKMEDNNFTELEIALLTFLAKHKVATRNQIRSAIFEVSHSEQKVRDFIKKMLRHGVIIAFKWVSPCRVQDTPENAPYKRKSPHVYGLSPVGAKAAMDLLPYIRLPRKFQFMPTKFVAGQAPNMLGYFENLIANEFFCRLHEMDRVIEWDVNTSYELPTGYIFRPSYIVKTIKDENDYKYLWLEVIRPQSGWYEHTQSRLRHMEAAISSISSELRPEVVILLVDNISRIPDLAELVETYMPNIEVRYTTDERVLQKESDAFFYKYSKAKGPTLAKIKHLTFDWLGLTASEYHYMIESFNDSLLVDDDDEDDY